MTDNRTMLVKINPERRKRLEVDIERLVKGLFQGERVPLFDRGEIPLDDIDAFARSAAVFDACFRFVRALDDAWQTQHPGQSLWVSKAARANQQHTGTPLNEPETAMAEPHPTAVTSATDAALTTPIPEAPATDPVPDPAPSATPVPQQTPQPAHATFYLPNAKVGVDYCALIEGQDASGEPVKIRDLRLPDELGLTFDPDTGAVRGTPLRAGDYQLPVFWGKVAGTSYSGSHCLLIVNPDPKSLWKVIEPPADAPYPKPHADSRRIESASGLQLIAASRRGRSHEHQGSFRDDDFYIQADIGVGWQLLSVADGAGSAQFSREGSRLAVTALAETLTEALAGDQGAQFAEQLSTWHSDPGTAQQLGTAFHYLFHQAGKTAVQAIEKAAATQGARPRDYATTLLAAVVKPQDDGLFLASFWMGDGAIAVYGPSGAVRLMGTPDGGEFAGQTRFLDAAALADSDFGHRIRIGFFQDVAAIILMTDGVSDPRFETDNALRDPARWDALWQELTPVLAGEEADRALADWLGFFSPGHHDDRTLALLRV